MLSAESLKLNAKSGTALNPTPSPSAFSLPPYSSTFAVSLLKQLPWPAYIFIFLFANKPVITAIFIFLLLCGINSL